MKRIIVFGSDRNSTHELYIKHRLPTAADVTYVDTRWNGHGEIANDFVSADVIINRYVSQSVVRWLTENRYRIGKIIYVVDDSLGQMVVDRSIPAKAKVRPLITLTQMKKLRHLVDHIYVSTPNLAQKFAGQPVSVIPPVCDLSQYVVTEKDPAHLCYFAKFHRREHRFLKNIVARLLDAAPELQFSVIVDPETEKVWKDVPRANLVREMASDEYDSFIRTCRAGTFLVPLLESRLNDCRSSAKRVEAAKLGAAPIFSNSPAYQDPRGAIDEIRLPNDPDIWLKEIIETVRDHDRWQAACDMARAITKQDFDNRQPLV